MNVVKVNSNLSWNGQRVVYNTYPYQQRSVSSVTQLHDEVSDEGKIVLTA